MKNNTIKSIKLLSLMGTVIFTIIIFVVINKKPIPNLVSKQIVNPTSVKIESLPDVQKSFPQQQSPNDILDEYDRTQEILKKIIDIQGTIEYLIPFLNCKILESGESSNRNSWYFHEALSSIPPGAAYLSNVEKNAIEKVGKQSPYLKTVTEKTYNMDLSSGMIAKLINSNLPDLKVSKMKAEQNLINKELVVYNLPKHIFDSKKQIEGNIEASYDSTNEEVIIYETDIMDMDIIATSNFYEDTKTNFPGSIVSLIRIKYPISEVSKIIKDTNFNDLKYDMFYFEYQNDNIIKIVLKMTTEDRDPKSGKWTSKYYYFPVVMGGINSKYGEISTIFSRKNMESVALGRSLFPAPLLRHLHWRSI